MKIIYHKPEDAEEFDLERYFSSLSRYGVTDREAVKKAVEKLPYPTPHVSVLNELAIKLIPDDNEAKRYWEEHKMEEQGFERLARITGYLVGSLDRWNSGKRAEWAERYSHPLNGQFSPDEKDEIERKKRIVLNMEQVEYRKI